MVLYIISKLNLIYNMADQAYVIVSFVYTHVVVISHKVEYPKIIKTTIWFNHNWFILFNYLVDYTAQRKSMADQTHSFE